MKISRALFPILLISAIALLAGCATHESLTITVVRTKPDAYYSQAGGSWQPLARQTVLKPGMAIKTGTNSLVDIAFDAKPDHPIVPRDTVIPPEQSMRIFGASSVKIEQATHDDYWDWKYSQEKLLINLSSGSIGGNTLGSAVHRKFEVILTNGTVIFSTNAFYTLAASGKLVVVRGRVSVSLADKNLTREISDHHIYDPASGTVRELPPDEERVIGIELFFGDVWPKLDNAPTPPTAHGMGGSMRKF